MTGEELDELELRFASTLTGGGGLRAFARAVESAEREQCIERVKTCLYLDWDGHVLPFGPVSEVNSEIQRCIAAIRAHK